MDGASGGRRLRKGLDWLSSLEDDYVVERDHGLVGVDPSSEVRTVDLGGDSRRRRLGDGQ